MGGIFQRNGKWYVYYRANGKRIRRMIGLNKKEAQIYLGKKEAEVREGRHFDVRKEHKITFGELFKAYMLEYSAVHHKPRSRERHETSAKRILPFFGNILLKDINPALVQRYIGKRRADGVMNSTINRELALMKHCFSIGIRWDWAQENPLKRVEMLREPKGRVRYLSPEERERLFTCLPWYIKPIVIFGMHTGMRKSEILGLKWSQVSLKNRRVVLEDTKNNERRAVPLNDTAFAVLQQAGKVRRLNIPCVFFNPLTGEPWQDIHHAFKRACKAAGVSDFRFHDLRHTAASYLVMAGVDLTSVKELLGHKTIDMTLRYAHLSPTHMANVANVLDSVFSVSDAQKEAVLSPGCPPGPKPKVTPMFEDLPTGRNDLRFVAGATGIEPATPGFGERDPHEQAETMRDKEDGREIDQTPVQSGSSENKEDKSEE